MEGVSGFFRYVEMKGSLKTDEEILNALFQEAEADLATRIAKIEVILQRALAARRADGDRMAKEVEEAQDITAPARDRIASAKRDHSVLHKEIAEVEDMVKKLKSQMDIALERKILLTRKLHLLASQLSSSSDEPRWMMAGTLEELRRRGREYGSHCSRR